MKTALLEVKIILKNRFCSFIQIRFFYLYKFRFYLKLIFNRRRKSGYIDVDDLKLVYEELDIEISEDEIADLLEDLDIGMFILVKILLFTNRVLF